MQTSIGISPRYVLLSNASTGADRDAVCTGNQSAVALAESLIRSKIAIELERMR